MMLRTIWGTQKEWNAQIDTTKNFDDKVTSQVNMRRRNSPVQCVEYGYTVEVSITHSHDRPNPENGS